MALDYNSLICGYFLKKTDLEIKGILHPKTIIFVSITKRVLLWTPYKRRLSVLTENLLLLSYPV